MIVLTSLFSALACASSNQEFWVPDPISGHLSVLDSSSAGRLSQTSKELYEKFKEHLQREMNNRLQSDLDSLIPVTQEEGSWFMESLSSEAVNVRYFEFLSRPLRRKFKFSNLIKPITILLDAVQPSGITTGINHPLPRLNVIDLTHSSRVGHFSLNIHLEQESGLYTISFGKVQGSARARNHINDRSLRQINNVQQIKLLFTPNDMSHPRGGTQLLNSFEIQCDNVSIGKFWFRPGIFDGMADDTGNEAEDSEAENYRGHRSQNCDIAVATRISPYDRIPVQISFREA